MPESVEVIQFGKRAKIMTNKLGLRPTITEYAKKAKLFIKDVKYYDHRPNGVEEYDAHDFYGKDLSHA
jgi:S-adenosylmethionine/arginine decarboxylase-like enzyme